MHFLAADRIIEAIVAKLTMLKIMQFKKKIML
jgi:hypothetical protein